jgi:hypothetical protein
LQPEQNFLHATARSATNRQIRRNMIQIAFAFEKKR